MFSRAVGLSYECRMRRHGVGEHLLLLVTGVLGSAASASAEPAANPEPVFGEAGRIAFSGSVVFLRSTEGSPPADADPAAPGRTQLIVSPALQFFVAENLALGAHVSFGLGWVDDVSRTIGVGLYPTVGYNLRFGERWSILPELFFGFRTGTIKIVPAFPFAAPASAFTNVTIGASVPLLFHPATHLFIGLGPFFSTDLVATFDSRDQAKATLFAIQSVIGGWF